MKRILASLLCLLPLLIHAEDKSITVGSFKFMLPDPWVEGQNTGMMTKAMINYPVDGGEPLVAKFYDFGGPSGGKEANIQRWISQFEGTPDVKKDELTMNGATISLLTVSGTYMDGMPGGPKTSKPDSTLLGAIIALEGSDSTVFIKLAGPKAAVAKAQEAFKKLATSPFPTTK